MNFSGLNDKLAASERALARTAGISRTTLRLLKEGKLNPTLQTLKRLSAAEGLNLEIIRYPQQSSIQSEFSTSVISFLVSQQNFDSWKIHFMNFVDEVRRSKDYRLITLPPVRSLDPKLSALLAAIVLQLCWELEWPLPPWAVEAPRLDRPWFVAESEALKASAILESPIYFKSKNIFVLENFLGRV
jgi:transcriptional regulator with XRE-family HTH domain